MEESEEQSNINFVTCAKWVRKGVAKSQPEKVQLTKEELTQVIQDTKNKLRISTQERSSSSGANQDQYNFEHYDDSDDEDGANALGISSLAELENDAEDNFSESDDSDKEDEVIKAGDNLILVGHVMGDASTLEVYIYNEEEASFYVHHDIILPAFPLCIEWLNFEKGAPKGSYCAVGTMSSQIEIWDLDIINTIEPAFTLGKKKSVKKNRPHVGHTDAVLAVAWNPTYEHLLGSGSVDKTILLWDLEEQKPTTVIKAFNDKVQCMEWHPLEAQTLLAGGADKKAKVFDGRTPNPHHTWELEGEAERVSWCPLQPYMFFASNSSGSLQLFDCRKGVLWSKAAHEKEVTGLSVSRQCPGLIVTASPDEEIKIWDYNETEPVLVYSKNFNLGVVHCLDLSPDSPFVICAGGDNKSNNFMVYDIRNIETVQQRFADKELMELQVTEESVSSEN